MVSPLKAPSSAGKSAARKSEPAVPPAAPGPSEFAASLQGIFAVLDAPARLREDLPARPESAGREASVPPRFSGGAERRPAAFGGEAPPPGSEPVGAEKAAPPIERALGALEEIRRREGLQPAPKEAPSPAAREAPAAPAPEAVAEASPPEAPPVEAESPAPAPPDSDPAAEAPPGFKDIEILDLEIPGPPGTGSAAAVPGTGIPPALPVFAAAPAGFETPSPLVVGEAEEGTGEVLGIPAASGVRASALKPGLRGAEPVTPAETVDRIVQAAQLLKTRGATRLRLRLDPPNLGGLRVDLSVRQGVLQGRIQAESTRARDLLVAQLDQLKAALEAQGLQVGEFQVGVDPSFHQASGDPSGREGSSGSGERGPSEEDGNSAAAPEPPGRRAIDQRLFDVTI